MTKITFSNILSTSKVILATFAIIGTLYTAFIIYYKWQENQIHLTKKVEKLIENDTLLFDNLFEINKNLETLNNNVEETNALQIITKNKVDNLQSSYMDFLKNDKSLTKEDFMRYMMSLDLGAGMESKKNLIPYPLMTQQK